MSKKTQHVIFDLDFGWVVKKGGSLKATKKFVCKAGATEYGSDLAKNHSSKLIIHSKDGKIERIQNYSKENKDG